jgi:hypothetical protein
LSFSYCCVLVLESMVNDDVVTVLIQQCVCMQNVVAVFHLHEIPARTTASRTIDKKSYSISMFPLCDNGVTMLPNKVTCFINFLRLDLNLYSR